MGKTIVIALGGNALGENPVSYTHLRAHETVLDLVCRLLLEKKKNKTQSIDDSYKDTNRPQSEEIS